MKAPLKIENYHYKGFHGNDCFCPIHIWRELNLVIIEHSMRALPSPQQMSETIAEDIIRKYDLKIKDLVWIDYVPANCYSNRQDNYRLVTFEVNKSIFSKSFELISSSTTFRSIQEGTLKDFIAGSIKLRPEHKMVFKLSA